MRRPILIIAIIVVAALVISSFSLGLISGGKTATVTNKVTQTSTTTVTSSSPPQTYTITALSTLTQTYTSTITIKETPNAVNVSKIFAEAYPSVVQVNIYDSNLNMLALGSGFLYDLQGHIVTNYHVISNGAYFVIQTYDNQWINATLKGADSYADLAVLEANMPLGIKPLKLASKIMVGEPAFAIGSPFGLEGSITSGIVSQVNRTGITVVPMLQTDAAINPGNSGGPLLNSEGDVIGVNTAGIPSNVSQSIGFAIPSGIVGRVVPKLIESGKYEHPFIGIGGGYLDPILAKQLNLPSTLTYGYYITNIVSGSSASKSGLKVGDVIVKIDNYNIRKDPDINYLMTYIYSPSQKVTFTVIRDGHEVQIQLILGVRG